MNTHAPPVRLTERERTVIESFADGDMHMDIASNLRCSLSEVNDVTISAIKKLDAHTLLHAIALAIRGGHIL